MKKNEDYNTYVKLTLRISMLETIQNKVGALRQERGMTQEELASLVGVTRQTIIALEKGNYVPSVLLALKIARVFKVEVEKMFGIQSRK
jgi:putative transcriptional regulator